MLRDSYARWRMKVKESLIESLIERERRCVCERERERERERGWERASEQARARA